eukprot:m.130288 g.130288  ORF g.130288 m.130288 type:complete len:76 (-) comp17466_c0_seq18:1445-1672(-)
MSTVDLLAQGSLCSTHHWEWDHGATLPSARHRKDRVEIATTTLRQLPMSFWHSSKDSLLWTQLWGTEISKVLVWR